MLPGTAAYLFAGSSIGSLGDLADRGVAGVITSQLFVAMLILGLLPIAAKLFVNHVLKRGGNLQAETPSG